VLQFHSAGLPSAIGSPDDAGSRVERCAQDATTTAGVVDSSGTHDACAIIVRAFMDATGS
jgi:hypothetical protein